MTFEKLKGRMVEINGNNITVNSIKQKMDSDGTVYFIVNDSDRFSRFDVTLACSLVEIEDKKKEYEQMSWLAKLKLKFGMFVSIFNNELTDEYTEKDVVKKFDLKFDRYSYKKCGISFIFSFFKKSVWISFCWNNKDIYEKEELPHRFIGFKKVF
jgi:hypothetical protein